VEETPGSTEHSSYRGEDAELVFSLCHELGNMMGALRLHAHLLDDDMVPKDLARTAVDLDDLSARSAALLSLIRPLLSMDVRAAEVVSVSLLVQNLEGIMAGYGARGTNLSFSVDGDLPPIRIDVGMMQRLIQSFFYFALDSASRTGSVWMRAEARGTDVALIIEDDGPPGEDPAGYRDQMRRGRPLLCCVAESILQKRDGRFEAQRSGDRTVITLILPAFLGPPR